MAAATDASWVSRDSRMELAFAKTLAHTRLAAQKRELRGASSESRHRLSTLAEESGTDVESHSSKTSSGRNIAQSLARNAGGLDEEDSELLEDFENFEASPTKSGDESAENGTHMRRGQEIVETRSAKSNVLRTMTCFLKQPRMKNAGHRGTIGGTVPWHKDSRALRELRKLDPDSLFVKSLMADHVRLQWDSDSRIIRVTNLPSEVLVLDLIDQFLPMQIMGNVMIVASMKKHSKHALPSGLHIRGNLLLMTEFDEEGDFTNPAQISLPNSLYVGGNLMLLNIEVLRWGSPIWIGGDFAVREAMPWLVELPAFAELGGTLDCRGCTMLRELPKLVEHFNTILLDGCTSLETLPVALASVQGDLSLVGCKALKSLPDYLIVEGGLYLQNCTSLTALPSLLTVIGDVNLQGAIRLNRVPVNINLCGGKLDLRDCISLRRLPLAPFERKRSRRLIVDARGTSIDPVTCKVLRSIETDTVKFQLDPSAFMSSTLPSQDSQSGDVTDQLGNDHTTDPSSETTNPRRRETQVLLEMQNIESVCSVTDALELFGMQDIALERHIDYAYHRDVIEFLKLLASSLENRVPELRKLLKRRLRDVLEIAANDDVAREEILLRIVDSVDTCVDKPIWALGQMELVAALAHARGNRTQLRVLGRGVMRLGIVHKHAAIVLNASDLDVDDVCVYLKFELALRDALQLPVSPHAMEWDQYVNIDPHEIAAARAEAIGITDEAFENWLEEWPPWQTQLRSEAIVPYESLKSPELSMDINLADATDLYGEPILDPVLVLPDIANPWSYKELCTHWVRTGMDFSNNVISPSQFLPRVQKLRQRDLSKQSSFKRRLSKRMSQFGTA